MYMTDALETKPQITRHLPQIFGNVMAYISGFQPSGILFPTPRGHLAMSGNIFGCYSWEGHASGE